MKSLFIILGVLLVAAVIALKVTSHKDQTTTQSAREAQPTMTSKTRPGSTSAAGAPTFQVTNAAEKPLRQKIEEDSRYAGILAKEGLWREKFKGLKKGMTVQQAVAVMGEPPTFLLARRILLREGLRSLRSQQTRWLLLPASRTSFTPRMTCRQRTTQLENSDRTGYH